MQQSRQIIFKPFRLDIDNACLCRGNQKIALTPKAFAVLQYLVMHHDRLVTKDVLFEAIWPDTSVGDAALKVCIREIRRVLGDTAKTPRFIATAYRQGYRFIRPVHIVEESYIPQIGCRVPSAALADHAPPHPYDMSPHATLVGRDHTFTCLYRQLEQACEGKRQMVFVTGEAGIGKTALVESFAAQVASEPNMLTIQVACIEQYGASEAYLPILEAIHQLCRGPHGKRLITLLRQVAPTWLIQIPWLADSKDLDVLQCKGCHSTSQRMLREIVEFIEVLTIETPLVLIIEDMHWSDYATLDFVSFLARRQLTARLMLIGTYRPVEVILNDHPLKKVKQTLDTHGQCIEQVLELLSERDMMMYFELQFGGKPVPRSLIHWIHQRTNGNPLFLVNMVKYLIGRNILGFQNAYLTLQTEISTIEEGVPESLRQMIEQMLERLSPDEQNILEAASVSGTEFTTEAVAIAMEREPCEIESLCHRLEQRHQFFHCLGVVEWPDGTMTVRYEFRHWLYQRISYDRMNVIQRLRFHNQIGRRLEAAYGQHASHIAAELAVHFARGRQLHRAIWYLQTAAKNAQLRFAEREAIGYLNRASELIEMLQESERDHVDIHHLKQKTPARSASLN